MSFTRKGYRRAPHKYLIAKVPRPRLGLGLIICEINLKLNQWRLGRVNGVLGFFPPKAEVYRCNLHGEVALNGCNCNSFLRHAFAEAATSIPIVRLFPTHKRFGALSHEDAVAMSELTGDEVSMVLQDLARLRMSG